MKRFEELFFELKRKIEEKESGSGTVKEYESGIHNIGKKIIEEAGEVWIASEYEGKEKTAEEISQLLYHIQVMMIACGITLEDVYKYL
ncbi:MAG: phosphoribosyl-ATP diphosphatase [Deltaproteobacteria bacterium]|nr:MAG: phosphoribosyl-ATP diphosphatase [Deltaproteobacteria bacterium]